MTVPTIPGIAPGTVSYLLLQQHFLGAYFTQLQVESQPLLGCSIVFLNTPVSTLSLTNLNFIVNPYINPTTLQPYPNPSRDQQQISTLNYLCTANGNVPPSAATFPWNWLDFTQLNNCDGAIAINRNTLANCFRDQLASYVPKYCILPSIRASISPFDTNNISFSWKLTPSQTPTVTTPSSGQIVLSFDYSKFSIEQAGLNGALGDLRLTSTYNLTVEFVGNTIIITQHLVFNISVRQLRTSGEGNIFDKKIVDTYTIGISNGGKLVELSNSPQSVLTDNSNSPSVINTLNFFSQFNATSNYITNSVSGFTGTRMGGDDIPPVSAIQNFVFPGGKSFVFSKSVGFSAFQDLVSFISYN